MNKELGIQPQEKLNSGQIVKGIILNAMGFVSQPLYLFPQFFKDKATEHILCEGIQAEKAQKILHILEAKKSKNRTELQVLLTEKQKQLKYHRFTLKKVTKIENKKNKR